MPDESEGVSDRHRRISEGFGDEGMDDYVAVAIAVQGMECEGRPGACDRISEGTPSQATGGGPEAAEGRSRVQMSATDAERRNPA